MLSLPNKDGKFIYQISTLGNKLICTLSFAINKSLFLPTEYDFLKQFYQMVINKQNEPVVLKKK